MKKILMAILVLCVLLVSGRVKEFGDDGELINHAMPREVCEQHGLVACCACVR